MSQNSKEVARLMPDHLTRIHVKEFKIHHCVAVRYVYNHAAISILQETLKLLGRAQRAPTLSFQHEFCLSVCLCSTFDCPSA